MQMFTQADDDEILERANIAITRVNLVDANKKLPAEISGGMKKRGSHCSSHCYES